MIGLVRFSRNFSLYSEGQKLVRTLSTQSAASFKPSEDEYAQALPFDQIPGLSKFELLKRFLPGGKFHKKSITNVQLMLRNEFGDFFKTPGMFGQKAMLTMINANDIEFIYRMDGPYPYRRGLETMQYHRKKLCGDVFSSVGGLIIDQGHEWHKMRSAVNPILMHPRTVQCYIPIIDDIVKDFMQNIPSIQSEIGEMPANFSDYLNRWSLESITAIALEKRLGLMDFGKRNEAAEKIATTIRSIFELAAEFEMKPSMWRFYETKEFKKLLKAYDDLTNLSSELIDEAKERYDNRTLAENDKEESMLVKLLQKDKTFATIMAIDMIFGGVDTTTSSIAGILYCLAKNPDKQEKLREELMRILPDKTMSLTPDNMKNMPYLRAVIKEGIRLLPPVSSNMRRTTEKLVVRGFQVPIDVDIMFVMNQIYDDASYFGDPESFVPERWLKQKDESVCPNALKPSHPFSYLPFGFGVRFCIGKRIAQMEMEVFLSRILRNYRVEWHYGEFKVKAAMVNIPVSELKFRLINV